jgi:hypothetical protein
VEGEEMSHQPHSSQVCTPLHATNTQWGDVDTSLGTDLNDKCIVMPDTVWPRRACMKFQVLCSVVPKGLTFHKSLLWHIKISEHPFKFICITYSFLAFLWLTITTNIHLNFALCFIKSFPLWGNEHNETIDFNYKSTKINYFFNPLKSKLV